MGTEVESPNSNHQVAKIITDSFLFLDGEEDGTGTNGNHGNGNHATGKPAGSTQQQGWLNSGGGKATRLSANGNSSHAVLPAANRTESNNSEHVTSCSDNTGSEGGEVTDVGENVTQGASNSVTTDLTQVGEAGGRTGEPPSLSIDGDPDSTGLLLHYNQQQQPLTQDISISEAKVNTSDPSCDNMPSSTIQHDGMMVGQSQVHHSVQQQKQQQQQQSGQNTHSSSDNSQLTRTNGLSVEEESVGAMALSTEAAAAAYLNESAEAYEARLKEQARLIVGQVLNCNSLREALKKSQALRYHNKKRPALRDSYPACGAAPIAFCGSVAAAQGGSKLDGGQGERSSGRSCGQLSDSLIHTTVCGMSESCLKTRKCPTNSEQCNFDDIDLVQSDTNSVITTEAQKGKSKSEPDISHQNEAQMLFDDQSADTTCTVAASAAVKLRRKKSELGTKPSFEPRERGGSLDSNSSSPCASPGVAKRHVLRSPVLRIKQEWNNPIDILSDSDSSPRGSEDSDDDDDGGIYADSYRQSQWLYIGGTTGASSDNLDDSGGVFDTSLGDGDVTADASVTSQKETSVSTSVDSGIGQSESSPRLYKQRLREDDLPATLPRRPRHHRTESISTTASEIEFRKRYQAKTKRIVHRQSSAQTYQRMSERFYDEERCVVIEKGSGDMTFGFHIKGHAPVMVSTVELDSAAERAGVKVGDAVIAVNDINIMEVSHHEAIRLISLDTSRVKLTLATDQRVLSDLPLCSGFLIKQGGSGILKNWRRRWFVLKQDHCLYYYKTEEDKDPLGAIMLTNYTVTKAPEANRKHTFKAHKYGQRTYYFQADSEDDMNRWASALSNAAKATTKTDTWLDVSSHNVGLPALSIKSPDCHGHLTKMGNRRKNWKRRYCVLKDACLYYYIDLTSSTAQGVAHLHGYTVEDNLPFNRKFGFMLVPPDTSMRTFYFCADNETDMKRWIKALQVSIGRWVREDED